MNSQSLFNHLLLVFVLSELIEEKNERLARQKELELRMKVFEHSYQVYYDTMSLVDSRLIHQETKVKKCWEMQDVGKSKQLIKT